MVYIELPAAGLGNKMLVWARGYVFARKYGLRSVCTRWWGLSWGALLRRERKKRLYLGYFKEDSLLSRMRLFFFRRSARVVEEPVAPEAAPGQTLYVFRKMFVGNDYFETLKPYREELGTAIIENLRPAIRAQLEESPRPVIGIHVRRGDFKRGSTLTPTSFFVHSILAIRAAAGACLPVTVFTDAYPTELQELLSLPAVNIAETKADILDILLLSRSAINILSISSTFSFWAGFLNDGIVLKHPGEWHPALRPPSTDDSKYEGNFDPAQPMDPQLSIALKKLKLLKG
jgi:hypothetical protein